MGLFYDLWLNVFYWRWNVRQPSPLRIGAYLLSPSVSTLSSHRRLCIVPSLPQHPPYICKANVGIILDNLRSLVHRKQHKCRFELLRRFRVYLPPSMLSLLYFVNSSKLVLKKRQGSKRTTSCSAATTQAVMKQRKKRRAKFHHNY